MVTIDGRLALGGYPGRDGKHIAGALRQTRPHVVRVGVSTDKFEDLHLFMEKGTFSRKTFRALLEKLKNS